MVKKIMCIGLVLVMIFSLPSCEKDFNLEEYKKNAKDTIETYVESKGEDNYSEENWIVINDILMQGIEAIEAATEASEVDSLVITIKQDIDNIPQKDDDDIELQIRQDFLVYRHNHGETYLTLEDIEILKNYGSYGDSVVVKMDRGHYPMGTTVTIAEVSITFWDSNTALVWKDSHFYELEEAYNQELLTKADLLEIADIQNQILNN